MHGANERGDEGELWVWTGVWARADASEENFERTRVQKALNGLGSEGSDRAQVRNALTGHRCGTIWQGAWARAGASAESPEWYFAVECARKALNGTSRLGERGKL